MSTVGSRWFSLHARPSNLWQASNKASASRTASRKGIFQSRFQHNAASSSHLPRLAQPSIWQSIIPRFLRSGGDKKPGTAEQKKITNPATYFIWIYLFIGSQAIRIISIQNEFNTYMRKAEVKIGRLREVVEKLQKGEPVDVERVLGTGDEIQEREWEEALKELEEEDRLWAKNKRRREEEQAKRVAQDQDASPVSDIATSGAQLDTKPPRMPFKQTPGFY